MATEILTSTANASNPSSAGVLKPTVDAGAPADVAVLRSSSLSASEDSVILESEVSSSFSDLLATMASSGGIQETSPVAILSKSSEEVGAFIQDLQSSVFAYKAATPQGLLMKAQLDNGDITQEEFVSSVNALAITSQQARMATSSVLDTAIQKFLISISNDTTLNTLKLLIKQAEEKNPDAIGADPSEKTDSALSKNPPSSAPKKAIYNDKGEIIGYVTDYASDMAIKEAAKRYFLYEGASEGNPNAIGADPSHKDDKALARSIITLQTDTSAKNIHTLQSAIWTQDRLPKTSSEGNPNYQTHLQTDQPDSKIGINLSYIKAMVKAAEEAAKRNLKASESSFLSLRPQPKVMTGARAVVKLNGKVAALCINVNYDITTDWSEIRGIDEVIPQDLAPNSYLIKGSMSLYRVPGESPIARYLHPDMFRSIIWPYAVIEIRDKRTDELLLLINKAAITSRAESYAKGQLTTTTLNFIAITFRDEEIPSLLPDELPGDIGRFSFKSIKKIFGF